MHIHWFQHDDFEDMAFIGQWAESHHHTTSVTRFDLSPELPAPDSFDWLVIMGGKMGVYETGKYPWLVSEIEFIRETIDAGKIVIGICLGSQLIASALGSRVFKNREPERGLLPVTMSKEAHNDNIFRHFPDELHVLHVHDDTFDLPKGATLLASSVITPNQAFRYGRNVFAFQFHFEVTSDRVALFFNDPDTDQDHQQKLPGEIPGSAAIFDGNNRIFGLILNEIAMLK